MVILHVFHWGRAGGAVVRRTIVWCRKSEIHKRHTQWKEQLPYFWFGGGVRYARNIEFKVRFYDCFIRSGFWWASWMRQICFDFIHTQPHISCFIALLHRSAANDWICHSTTQLLPNKNNNNNNNTRAKKNMPSKSEFRIFMYFNSMWSSFFALSLSFQYSSYNRIRVTKMEARMDMCVCVWQCVCDYVCFWRWCECRTCNSNISKTCIFRHSVVWKNWKKNFLRKHMCEGRGWAVVRMRLKYLLACSFNWISIFDWQWINRILWPNEQLNFPFIKAISMQCCSILY